MAQQNPTIIVGHLDSSDLTKSIDKLVKEVAEKTNVMANDFTQAIDKMKFAMKDFAITQKVSVDLMKEAWRDMSKSFDAMVAAQSASTGGGKGSGKVHAPNTIGALEQEIAEIKQERKELELNSDELRIQNGLLERRKNLYKEQTTSLATKRVDSAMSLSTNKLDEAEKKLRLLEILQRRYAGTAELSVAQQNRLARAIQRTKEQIDKLKPKSLQDVLNMDESSFDAIAKKMAALKRVSWANPQEQKQVTDEYQRLRQEQNKLLASNAQLSRSNNYLAQSFGYIRNRIVYALTLGAMTNFVKQIYEVRGQYELLERSLGVLVNSFERGSQVFNELNQMAIESPFTLMELAGAAKQLTAYNFAANEVVDTTRRLADISAALGVPMERLTYNLGQIRAQTVLNARDARDFANAGLPIVKSLSDYYTELEGKIVSTGDVYDRMSKKMVSYNDVMAVLNKMTDEGGKFFEFQAKQAQTLRVQMANLTLAWNNMLNEMGRGNQGLLSLPIQGLKVMLQNWASLNRVLKNVVLSFGLLKVAQMAAIRYNWQLAASAGGAARMMGFLGNVIKSVYASTKALFTNHWTWIFVVILAVTDLIGKWRAARQEIAELNDELKENAREAANSNFDFFNNKGNIETRKLAKENKLTAEQGEKAWEAIEQQISTSAMSANKLLGELWAINDVNERVSKGFDYVQKINNAQAALAQFGDDILTITQDKGWWGMFGEGLVSDLKDFKNELDGFKGTSDELNKILNTNYGDNNTIKIAFKELQGEIKETAESINNFIVANDIKDPIQINEILSRAKAIIKTRNPEIKGELATLFDMQLDEQMSKFNSNIDKSSSLWEMFMERLKHNSSATFQDITSDIYKENSKLSKEQQNAVDENLEYFKNTMPFYYNAVKDMVNDASRLKIQIGIAFNVKALTDFQQEVNDRIAKASRALDFGTEAMLPTQNDNLQTWVKTQQDAIKGLREQNKLYKKDDSEWSKEQIQNNDREIQQRKNLLDLFNQSYEKEKKNGGKKRDPMLDTLKQTIEIVKKLQSEYDTLTKSGDSSANALEDVRSRYSRTINLLNKDLQTFGLPKLNLEIIKGRNPNEILKYFQQISDILTNKGLSTLERQKAVEVVIQEFSLKAKTYNLDMITKGLNSELDRLKDEYELAVSLDADPELGSIFADWMGIDMDNLPRTAEEYAKRYTDILNEKMKERKADIELPNLLTITDENLREMQRRVGTGGITQTYVDEITKGVKAVRDVFSKELTSAISNYGKLLDKYGDYVVKVRRIEEEAATERKDLVMRFGNAQQKSKGLQLHTKILEEEDPVARQKLVDDLENLTNEVSKANPVALKINASIGNSENEKLAQASFEEFQKSREWVIATGDLATLSRSALGMLIKEIEKYKKTAKNLTPKQIKAINNTLKQLKREVRKNNPFAIIKNTIEDSKERMAAYQSDMDAVMSKIVKLEKKIGDREATEDEKKDLEALKQEWEDLYEKMKAIGSNGWDGFMQGLSSAMEMAKQASSLFTGMFSAFGDEKVERDVNRVLSVIDKTLQGAMMGTAIAPGYGTLIGAGVGLISGLVTTFADQWSGNKAITELVQESELSVKKLINAYKMLEDAAEQAFGASVLGAKEAIKANKELQLVELKRQLALEESRSGKNYDADKVTELKGQVIDLENEIKKVTKNTLNDILGISSHGEFFEDMISEMIDAFKNGEDAMKVFEEKWSNMIDNMIMKTIVSQVLQNWINSLEKGAEDIISKYTQAESDAIANHKDLMANILHENDEDLTWWIYENDRQAFNDILKQVGAEGMNGESNTFTGITKKIADIYKANMQSQLDELNSQLDKASLEATGELIDYYGRAGEDFKANYLDVILDKIKENWNFGQDSENKLSKLQQGIQGITEDQAGALEAYWNANTQQQYVHSDLLREIRNILAGGDADIQTGVQAQILLQLQQSYAVQMAIQEILNGVLTPSGQGFRVELVS